MTGITLPFPRVAPLEPLRAALNAISRQRVAIITALLLIAVAAAHGYNMLHYPYLSDDEGTYFSQGWAVFHLGRLAPYTYVYDHAPLGWIQIALWQLLTAGERFGYGLASGRVLMLVFQVGSALAVVGIGRRATGKLWVGLLAAALMSLLPFGIYYQRRILIDNIATFWLLVSIYAIAGPTRLRNAWFSAGALAVAILSKEIAIAAVPALLVVVARRYRRENRWLAVPGWIVLVLSICSVYVLLALLKGELFPAGSLASSSRHVSLLCSVIWQSTRSGGSGSASFTQEVQIWARSEPLLVLGGSACVAYLIVICRGRVVANAIGWTALLIALFLSRSAVVFGYYLLPLLPLLALSIAIALDSVASWIRTWANQPRGAGMLVLGVGLAAVALGAGTDWARSGTALYTGDPVAGQLAAERWIEHHLAHNSRMIIDMSMWQDLHVPTYGTPFRFAEDDWKAANDPAIRNRIFHNTWRKVAYVITTPTVISDAEDNRFRVVTRALEHSRLVKRFDSGGWTIEIRKVKPHARKILMHLRLVPYRQVSAGPPCMTQV